MLLIINALIYFTLFVALIAALVVTILNIFPGLHIKDTKQHVEMMKQIQNSVPIQQIPQQFVYQQSPIIQTTTPNESTKVLGSESSGSENTSDDEYEADFDDEDIEYDEFGDKVEEYVPGSIGYDEQHKYDYLEDDYLTQKRQKEREMLDREMNDLIDDAVFFDL